MTHQTRANKHKGVQNSVNRHKTEVVATENCGIMKMGTWIWYMKIKWLLFLSHLSYPSNKFGLYHHTVVFSFVKGCFLSRLHQIVRCPFHCVASSLRRDVVHQVHLFLYTYRCWRVAVQYLQPPHGFRVLVRLHLAGHQQLSCGGCDLFGWTNQLLLTGVALNWSVCSLTQITGGCCHHTSLRQTHIHTCSFCSFFSMFSNDKES